MADELRERRAARRYKLALQIEIKLGRGGVRAILWKDARYFDSGLLLQDRPAADCRNENPVFDYASVESCRLVLKPAGPRFNDLDRRSVALYLYSDTVI